MMAFEEWLEENAAAPFMLNTDRRDVVLRECWEAATERAAKIAEGDTDREDFPWCGDVREIAAQIRKGTP